MAKMQSIFSIVARGSHSIAGTESAVGRTSSSVAAAAAMRTSRVSESPSHEAEAATVRHNFWMKDPKSGNWIPENHFGEVDSADLRAKLLSKK